MMLLAKEIGRAGIEWFYVRGYAMYEIAAVYGVSAGYISSTVRLLYGAGWKKALSEKRENFQMEEINHEKQRISQLVCC